MTTDKATVTKLAWYAHMDGYDYIIQYNNGQLRVCDQVEEWIDAKDETWGLRQDSHLEQDRIWVLTYESGEQLLLNWWHKINLLTVAYRKDRWATWGKPVNAQEP